MTSYHERSKLIEAEKRPWSFEVAAAKARELAMKLNVPIYLVPVSGGYGQTAWDISKQSMEQREAYEAIRKQELNKLHPQSADDAELLQALTIKNQSDYEEDMRHFRRANYASNISDDCDSVDEYCDLLREWDEQEMRPEN